MTEHRYDIDRFIVDLAEIPSSDPLVDLPQTGGKQAIVWTGELAEKHTFPIDAGWQNVLKPAMENKRESDVQSLCIALHSITWEYKGKAVQSPLVLIPVDWKITKSTREVTLFIDPSQMIVNPFVRYYCIRSFDRQLNEPVTENSVAFAHEIRDQLRDLLPRAVFADTCLVGNFHHHRYQIIRELELISARPKPGRLVASVLGHGGAIPPPELMLHPGLLSASDADQQRVFERLRSEDLVVQGPPGTGKSQVLTNLIGKRLVHNGLTLVVSEKRVALEVLVKKLTDFNLHRFAFVAHSQTRPRDFIRHLKQTWLELEAEPARVQPPLLLSEQLKDRLQLLLDRLNHPTLTAGISFHELELLEKTCAAKSVPFRSDVPDLRSWTDAQPVLESLNRSGGLTRFQQRKYAFAVHPTADRIAAQLVGELTRLQALFAIERFGELNNWVKAAARLQLIDNASFRAYFSLLEQPAKRKRFEKAVKQFREVNARLQLLDSERNHWKRLPSLTEAQSWLQALSEKRAWFGKRKIPAALKQTLVSASISPETALTNWLAYLELQQEQITLREQFATWGIDRPEVELESTRYLLQRLEQEDSNELNAVMRLPENQKAELRALGDRVRQLRDDCLRYLYVEDTTPLSDLIALLSESAQPASDAHSLLRQLPESVYRVIAAVPDLTEAHAVVIHSNRQLLARQFPELSAYSGEVLHEKLTAILTTEAAEFEHYARYCFSERQHRFSEALQLLRTPSQRLSTAEKQRKALLKSGKALLVREFAKSRQHQTIRELLSGPAGVWIELLCPVWLSTPVQIGQLFPMEESLFELVVFDEASQIPLTNALGALQRSNRAIVAGDEQQMAPTAYFSGSTVSVDLLHQASWYWQKTPLRHHYRSEHPALIAFSNRHFYNNELVAYPTANSSFPLFRHFVETGRYIDRMNVPEAKAVAQFLETVDRSKRIGIIAFSEQQLQCIRRELSAATLEWLEEGIETQLVFFKALEQVQGDEADLIVISLGYARNDEDRFQLRFGPLNQSQGFKRLNVLLTRAKTALHFFTSVTAAEFAISSNESVQLLRQFLQQLEAKKNNAAAHTDLTLPFGLEAGQTNNTLSFPAIYTRISDARELITFHRILSERGWKLRYS